MIFRYLKGTLDFFLWYPQSDGLTLVAYTDIDWEGIIDVRITCRETYFLGNYLVSWLSKKQSLVSLSTT